MFISLRPLLLSLVICCFIASPITAEVSISEKINLAALAFEVDQDEDFKPVANNLEKWRLSQIRFAIKDLGTLLSKANAADQPFIAYHLLSVSPGYKKARDVFNDLGIKPPFDEKGQRVPDTVVPISRNRALVEQVSNLRYPPFSAVAEVVSPKSRAVQSYWKRQSSGLSKLRDELVKFAQQGQADNAYQVLAYYWPGAKEVAAYYASQRKKIPRQRTWFTSVDRYLLDHGLAGIDCLDTRMFTPSSGLAPQILENDKGAIFSGRSSWDFMENLRNCRMEGVFTTSGTSTFQIIDADGAGAQLVVKGKSVELYAIGKGKPQLLTKGNLEDDLSEYSSPVQLEIRGRFAAALVGGVQVCMADLPNHYAFKRITIMSEGLLAQQMRVRYLGELDDTEDLLTAAPKKELPPPEEPWRADRKKQLDRPVTFKFEDTSVEEVVALLSQLSGTKIDMDEKAETLKNLPVTLDGKDLKLSSALDWLERASDISWKATEAGVTLTWGK